MSKRIKDKILLRGSVLFKATIATSTYSVPIALNSILSSRISSMGAAFTSYRYKSLNVKLLPGNYGTRAQTQLLSIAYAPELKGIADLPSTSWSESPFYLSLTTVQTTPVSADIPSDVLNANTDLKFYDTGSAGTDDPQPDDQGQLVVANDSTITGTVVVYVQVRYEIYFVGAKTTGSI